MRGFLISFEALLSLLLLAIFLMEFFVPIPNTASIASFLELNDRFTAFLEAGQTPPFPEYRGDDDCVAIRYLPEVQATTISITPICIK